MKGMSIALALTSGLGMRLAMMKALPQVDFDTLLYGNMARNLVQHGQFAITDGSGVVHETLIRLPGYPLLLAACFRLFGVGNYNAVSYLQIGLELWGCLLLAAFVRRIASEAAAQWTLWLAALCPFTAAYAVAPLTETPTLFCIALALWALAKFLARPGWGSALAFTFAITFAALLRPDGALVGVALAPALVWGLWHRVLAARKKGFEDEETGEDLPAGAKAHSDLNGVSARLKSCPVTEPERLASEPHRSPQVLPDSIPHPVTAFPDPSTSRQPLFSPRPSIAAFLRMGLVCFLLAVLPFGIWAARNWRVFHVFMPLAPRYATDPGEATNPGWQRWMKTWCLDFVSTYQVYWNVPGSTLDVSQLPARAFDSPAQYARTAALAAAYSDNGQDLSPELDAEFGALAAERIHAHPLRYYLWLPLGRMADMWLRPRVENLNIDLDWWVYSHHNAETRFSWAYAALNAAYLLLALAGLCFRPRYWQWMLLYFVLRSALLMTIEAPEARYTLECFPMVFALGGVGMAAGWARITRKHAGA
jgi:hypothetical protein